MKNPAEPVGPAGASEYQDEKAGPQNPVLGNITRTASPQSLFAVPAPAARRRHRKQRGSMARRGTVDHERREIDLDISATWRHCLDAGCDHESWQSAGFADACLRYRRAFLGRAPV